MEEVVESDPGDDLRSLPPRYRSLSAPKLEGSRKDEGVRGARFELGGDRLLLKLPLRVVSETTDGHRDRSLGKSGLKRIAAASSISTC
jgi:hypothetical protein